MSLRSAVEAQFRRPHGLLGRLVGSILAHRPSNRRRNQWAVELLAPTSQHRVLEVGFGPGVALALIAKRTPAARLVGVDHSAVMLHAASRRNQALIDTGHLELYLGGLEVLDRLPGAFDRILSINVVQFWPHMHAALVALVGRLAPGGRIVTAYQPRHRGATAADAERMADRLRELQAEQAMTAIRIERLPQRPVPVIAVVAERNQVSLTSGAA